MAVNVRSGDPERLLLPSPPLRDVDGESAYFLRDPTTATRATMTTTRITIATIQPPDPMPEYHPPKFPFIIAGSFKC